MRTIQFSIDCPWPPVSGGDIRNACNARAAARLGEVLCVSLAGSEPSELPAGIQARVLDGAANRKPWEFRDPEHPTRYSFAPAELAHVEELCRRFRPEVALLEGVALAQLLPVLAAQAVRTVLDMHNIESVLYNEQHAMRRRWKRFKASFSHGARLKAAERDDAAAAQAADAVWVVSPEDGDAVAGFAPNAAIRHIPNPVPDESLFALPISEERYRSIRALFMAHLSYPPNMDAAETICRMLVPALRRLGQPFSVAIAGRSPHRRLTRFAHAPEVSVISDPAGAAPLLAQASYAPMPIRYGSGTRIKAVEALAAGALVVAYPKAVEGLGLIPDEHFVAAADVGEMTLRMAELADEPRRAASLAGAGRAFVKAYYAEAVIERKVAAALRQLVEAPVA